MSKFASVIDYMRLDSLALTLTYLVVIEKAWLIKSLRRQNKLILEED